MLLHDARAMLHAAGEHEKEREVAHAQKVRELFADSEHTRRSLARARVELEHSKSYLNDTKKKMQDSRATLRAQCRRFASAETIKQTLRKKATRLHKSLRVMNVRCTRLDSELQQARSSLSSLQDTHTATLQDLESTRRRLEISSSDGVLARQQNQDLCLELATTREMLVSAQDEIRSYQTQATLATYEASVTRFQRDSILYHSDTMATRLLAAESEAEALRAEAETAAEQLVASRRTAISLAHAYEKTCAALQKTTDANAKLATKDAGTRRKLKSVSMRLYRTAPTLTRKFAKEVSKALHRRSKKPGAFSIRTKQMYCLKTRALVRALVQSGCHQSRVGEIIQAVGKSFGINILSHVSRRTVQRCLVEGSVAATIQLGFDLSRTRSAYRVILIY